MCIGDADCKEQYNRIKPNITVQQCKEASQFSYHKRRWVRRPSSGVFIATAKTLTEQVGLLHLLCGICHTVRRPAQSWCQ